MNNTHRAVAALLGVTAIWGSTFFVIKGALDHVNPLDYLAIRFIIASVVCVIAFWHKLLRLPPAHWIAALALGGLYGLAQVAQTYGLAHTSASVSGFITGTSVVLTPVMLWVISRVLPSTHTWAAVGLALVGLAVLSLTGLASGGTGELLTLLGAALYAFHIIMLDRQARVMDATALTVCQLIGIAVTCLAIALPSGIEIPQDTTVWLAILYTAIIAGIVTMLAQTWAQRHLPPTRVALLLTFEPLFASLFAVLLGGEQVTLRLILGGSLIFVATYIGARNSNPVSASVHADPSPHETTPSQPVPPTVEPSGSHS